MSGVIEDLVRDLTTSVVLALRVRVVGELLEGVAAVDSVVATVTFG